MDFLGAILSGLFGTFFEFGAAFANDNLGPKQLSVLEDVGQDPSEADVENETIDECTED